MANVKITDLTSATPLVGTEQIEVVQSATSKKTTIQSILTWVLSKANVWAMLQTFANILVNQVYTVPQTFTLTGSNPSQAINLDSGSLITVDVTGASGTATLTFSNAKTGASYWIKIIQATTKVDISIANSGRFDGETGATVTGTNSVDLAIFLLYDGTGYYFNKSEVS